ncbi:MAG: ABC transporter permease [Reichenbachiella sp.]
MIKNYLKTAVRYLARQKGYTALNIIGLTIGISASLVIILYLFNELSYDKHHEKADRIYRISSDIKETDDAFRWTSTQNPLGPKVKEEFAEVEQSVRFVQNGRTRFEYQNINYFEEKIFYVDSTVFDVFTFEFISGNQETALDAPNSIVLNETIANRIFKGENPMGQTLKSDGDRSFQVTGVVKDMKPNSHIIANAMMSMGTIRERMSRGNWGGFNIFTYVLLNENIDPEAFEIKLHSLIEEYVNPIFEQYKITIKYELINILDIHLYSDFQGEPQPKGDITYIYIFSAICIFMVLIACINYMNLATAKSVKRATEVGIRKVLGSGKKRLMFQFLMESILITIAAFILSLMVLMISVPLINNSMGTNLNLVALANPLLISVIGLILLTTGIFGGSYPAFYLSKFLPVEVLKGGNSKKSGNAAFRKILVVVQFSISIFMLVGTGIIYDQMSYVSSKDLGFDKDQVIAFDLSNEKQRTKWTVLKNDILQSPNISSACTSTSRPGDGFSKNLMEVEMEEGNMDQKGINLYEVDYDYFPTLNIDFVEGRNFSNEYPSDTASAIIINQAMIKRFNWTDPIGKKFNFLEDSVNIYRVIGVVKDFHQRSLYNQIEPMAFFPNLNNGRVLVKIDRNVKESIASIKSSWAETFPNVPFEHSFLDAQFKDQYETDERRGNLFLGFSLMTILISCMGLLGLASFTTEQRTKEISIRKVLGASTSGLLGMLIRDFLILVFIAAIPAFVASWFFGKSWLENFEYSVEINYLIFALVLAITLIITVLSTGYFALIAATSNPANKLKYE